MKEGDTDSLLETVGFERFKVVRDRDHFAQPEFVGRQDLPNYSYLSFSSKTRASVVTIDIDTKYDHDRIASLPLTPNGVGINQISGHSQIYFELEHPVYGDGPPRRYFDAVARGLNLTLGGDPHFSRTFARNPLDASGEYEWHAQHSQRFSLNELHELATTDEAELPRATRSSKALMPERQYDGDKLLMRGVYLFDAARYEGYRLRGAGRTVLVRDIRRVLNELNQEIALEDSRGGRNDRDLDAIAKSVVRFCNEKMSPGRGSGVGLYTLEQTRRGGQRGGKVQGQRNVESGHLGEIRGQANLTRTMNSIVLAEKIRSLRESGLTHKAIMEALAVSESTVKRALRNL